MKIIIINGSLKPNGATGEILKRIESILQGTFNPPDIEYIDLKNTNLQFCTSCMACYKTGKCYINDGGNEVFCKIENADAFIFGSPTYVANVSAGFKNMMDRWQFVFRQSLKNKAGLSVATYANIGGRKTLKIIKSFIHTSGGAAAGSFLKKIKSGNIEINRKENSRLEKLCKKFMAKAEKKNPLNLFERILTKLIFKIGLKPHTLKNRERYPAIIERWINLGLLKKAKYEL